MDWYRVYTHQYYSPLYLAALIVVVNIIIGYLFNWMGTFRRTKSLYDGFKYQTNNIFYA